MKLTYQTQVNSKKLHNEILDDGEYGLQTVRDFGENSCEILFQSDLSKPQITKINSIVNAHNPNDYVEIRKNNAINVFLQSPLASMTLQEGYDWINAADFSNPNVIKQALTNLWTMNCALRNFIWSDILGQQSTD